LSSVFSNILKKSQNTIAHNVPAVCDVFLRPIKKPRSGFRAQKNVPEKNRTKGVARLRFFVGQAAVGGAAHTILLCEVPTLFTFFI
jgi:hypothetical protein